MPRAPFLQPTFHVHVHPSRLHLRRPSAERRGKTRRRSPSGSPCDWPLAASRATPDHLAVIRPPTATRLTARRWLRVDRLATSQVGSFRLREAACLFGAGRAPWPLQPASLRRVEPSDISLLVAGGSGAQSALLPAAGARWRQRHVNVGRRSGARRCLPPEESTRALFRGPCGASPRWPAGVRRRAC